VPFVSFTRQPLDDGANYIGPFYNSRALKNALRILRKIFPYYDKPTLPKKTDLNFQLGLTPGLESGAVSLAEYQKSLRQLISYLKGHRRSVITEIEKAMRSASKRQRYEKAAQYHRQLINLSELRKQVVFGREEFLDISKDQALLELRDMLKLEQIPRRIEGYDVSHISGSDNVASMVVFTNGIADKAKYRKFKLQTAGNDDYAHMHETISRRLKHLKAWGRPDLIIIDGGKGQLGAVADLLQNAKIVFIGRSKSGDHSPNAPVKLVVPSGKKYQEISLDNKSNLSKLIARLDGEAHRFAVNYHTTLRKSRQTKNALEEIAGIGPATRRKLLRHFGSITAIQKADLNQISAQIGPTKAKQIKLHLDPDSSNGVQTL
jgi:excinuclease ABC subunit C